MLAVVLALDFPLSRFCNTARSAIDLAASPSQYRILAIYDLGTEYMNDEIVTTAFGREILDAGAEIVARDHAVGMFSLRTERLPIVRALVVFIPALAGCGVELKRTDFESQA